MSNPFDSDPADGTNPFFMTESEQNKKSLIDFGDEQPVLVPSTTSVAYPPTTTTSLPKSPASSGSVKLIDIDDPPAQAQPQPQQPSTENSAKKGSAGNEKEEEVAEDVLFSFEPLPPEVKDINVADDKQRLLGEEPDNNNSNNGEEEEKRAPKKKKQQQQPKKAGGNNGDGDNEDRMWYHMFYKVSFYKPYFNVDTVDVGERIFRALVPTKSFFETTGENPDLYGPFWITTTLLFALAISSNFSNYISYWMAGRESEWGYDFERVSVATAVFYPYITLAPLAVWLTQKYWLKLAIPFVSCMCVYGYSLSSYAIGTIFCMLPIEWLRWTIILVCFLDSGLLIGEVFYTEFKQTDLKKKITVLSCIGVVHLAIVLTYKLYFFSAVSLSKADTSSLNT